MPHPDNKPAIAGAALSVAIPVRNQAEKLTANLSAWTALLGKLERPHEILLVDDGSSDNTVSQAEAFGAKHPALILLRHEQPRGFGAALRTALEKARFPLFFYTSFDYPYKPSDLRKLLERINDVDVVTGFRSAAPIPNGIRTARVIFGLVLRILIGMPPEPLHGWLGTKAHFYSRLVQLFFGVHVGDTDSAFKLFRREIFAQMPIQSEGLFVHVEILAKANFLTCWMDEIPIGAQDGSKLDALVPQIRLRERWPDMQHVFSRPDFGHDPQPPVKAETPPAEPAASAPK
jgi:hypothetical protein